MGEQQQEIPLLLLIGTEICLMFQVSKSTSVGKLLFIQGMILIVNPAPTLASSEFKGMPCVVKKFFLSLHVYQIGP